MSRHRWHITWVIALLLPAGSLFSVAATSPRRWLVERTLARLSHCRALLIRWNRTASDYVHLIKLACILLWYRRYARLAS